MQKQRTNWPNRDVSVFPLDISEYSLYHSYAVLHAQRDPDFKIDRVYNIMKFYSYGELLKREHDFMDRVGELIYLIPSEKPII